MSAPIITIMVIITIATVFRALERFASSVWRAKVDEKERENEQWFLSSVIKVIF